MTRITGLATGLDVDSVVKETMQAYQTKIDTVDQQKMVLELQQEMYREVIKDCRDFYDKYFNVVDKVSDSIENMSEVIVNRRYNEIKNAANEELLKGKKEYETKNVSALPENIKKYFVLAIKMV